MTDHQAQGRNSIESLVPKLEKIYDFITWGDFAKKYFPNHSVSWFYNKMRGVDGNGRSGGFTEEERLQLKQGLQDLAADISEIATLL